jgi:hypothetical protein
MPEAGQNKPRGCDSKNSHRCKPFSLFPANRQLTDSTYVHIYLDM